RDVPLLVLDERDDHRLPGDLRLEHDALGAEADAAALVQRLDQLCEPAVGSLERVGDLRGLLLVELAEDDGEVGLLGRDPCDRHRRILTYPAGSSPRRRASSSIRPWAPASCSAQRRYSSSPRSHSLVSSSSSTSPRSSRSTIRSSSAWLSSKDGSLI